MEYADFDNNEKDYETVHSYFYNIMPITSYQNMHHYEKLHQ